MQVGIGERGAGAEELTHKVGAGAADVAQTSHHHALFGLEEGHVAIAVFHHQSEGVEVGDIAMVFGGLAFAMRDLEVVGEEGREIGKAPHFVFAQCGLDVAELLN